MLLLPFSPPESLLVCTERGRALRELAPAIVSRQAGPRYLGYLRAQKERLLGTRGQRRAAEESALREEPDYDRVNAFLVETYRQTWNW